jgi:hypothetical protein
MLTLPNYNLGAFKNHWVQISLSSCIQSHKWMDLQGIVLIAIGPDFNPAFALLLSKLNVLQKVTRKWLQLQWWLVEGKPM